MSLVLKNLQRTLILQWEVYLVLKHSLSVQLGRMLRWCHRIWRHNLRTIYGYLWIYTFVANLGSYYFGFGSSFSRFLHSLPLPSLSTLPSSFILVPFNGHIHFTHDWGWAPQEWRVEKRETKKELVQVMNRDSEWVITRAKGGGISALSTQYSALRRLSIVGSIPCDSRKLCEYRNT